MKMCAFWADAAREAGSNHRDLGILNEMRKARGRQSLNLQSIRDYFSNWLEGRKPHLSPSIWRRYQTSILKFLGSLGDQAKAELQSLTAEQIEAFRASEQKAGLSASTLNMDLKAIRIGLNLAKLQINIASTIDAEHGKKAERQAFTLPQIGQLLKVADEDGLGSFTSATTPVCASGMPRLSRGPRWTSPTKSSPAPLTSGC